MQVQLLFDSDRYNVDEGLPHAFNFTVAVSLSDLLDEVDREARIGCWIFNDLSACTPAIMIFKVCRHAVPRLIPKGMSQLKSLSRDGHRPQHCNSEWCR